MVDGFVSHLAEVVKGGGQGSELGVLLLSQLVSTESVRVFLRSISDEELKILKSLAIV